MESVDKEDLEIRLLHQYFVWADRMRIHFSAAMTVPAPADIYIPLLEEPEKWLYMCFWYGSAYTVIEGWNQLGLTDPRIEELLARKEYVDALRRFRNGVFHFQRKLIDERFLDFIGLPSSAQWIHDLQSAFSDYFLVRFGIKPGAPPSHGESGAAE